MKLVADNKINGHVRVNIGRSKRKSIFRSLKVIKISALKIDLEK